jgi:signal transduction histidine kinase
MGGVTKGAKERARLAALHEARILDTPAEPAFDDLVAVASGICGAPIALISLVDRDRQWFKARLGIEATETAREVSFCDHAIRETGVFVVEDAALDVRFADNPLVTGEPRIRFYAGVPLLAGERHPIGTLCVIDRVPRTLTPCQHTALLALGRQVEAQLELRGTVRALIRAERQKYELTNLIVHDLKSPLSTITPNAEFLLDEPDLSHDARDAARAIISAAETMHRMVLDMLDVSIAEDGGLIPSLESVDLCALLEGIAQTSAHRCTQLRRSLELATPPAGTTLLADPDLLRRVLENLLDNAIKYSHARIRIDAGLADGAAMIHVRDDGAGVPPAYRDAIFDMRVRIPRDVRPHARSSRGLGLAFCRLAVEAHGGRIWVDDEPGGSAFHVYLPCNVS